MAKQSIMNLNVRLTGSLKRHVSNEVSEDGSYENVSEYVRHLIRKDKANIERLALETVKAELKLAFAAPESDYIELKAGDITKRRSPKSK
jgi:antitoxin ParD1/3/4